MGSLYQTGTATARRTCQDGRFSSVSGDFRVALSIRGSLAGGRRMQGQMPPETIGGTTETGSWDFAAR
jgi:hypothetical protein